MTPAERATHVALRQTTEAALDEAISTVRDLFVVIDDLPGPVNDRPIPHRVRINRTRMWFRDIDVLAAIIDGGTLRQRPDLDGSPTWRFDAPIDRTRVARCIGHKAFGSAFPARVNVPRKRRRRE